MTASPHPPDPTLQRLARGELPAEQVASIRAHVDQCPQCKKRLLSLDESTDSGAVPLPKTRDPQPGEMLGEYMVGEPLGQGGMGRVYRGRHPVIGKEVAIKVVLEEYATDESAVQRALNEARAVSAVHHPNIVDIVSFGVLPDGRPYMVMDLLRGSTLSQLVKSQGKLSLEEALPVLTQAMAGLEAAHATGVIHRDLKPDNIFVDTSIRPWRVTLVDFGLALNLTKEETRLTQTGMAVGTPAYMAPEQFTGEHWAATSALDVYAMGMVAWTMLVGKPPFGGGSAPQVMYRHINTEPPALRSAVPEVPETLDALVLAMLRKSPIERPSATEVRVALEALQSGGKVSLPRRRLSGTAKMVLAMLGSCFAVGAVAVAQLALGPDPVPPPQPIAFEPVPGPTPAVRDAGARVAVMPPTPAPPTPAPPPITLEGQTWRCGSISSMSPTYESAMGPERFFQIHFDGSGPLLVESAPQGKRTPFAALEKMRASVQTCRGRATRLIWARKVRNYSIWATKQQVLITGGVAVYHTDMAIIDAPPSLSARSVACKDIVEVSPIEEPPGGLAWTFVVRANGVPPLIIAGTALAQGTAPPALNKLRSAIEGCRRTDQQLFFAYTSPFSGEPTARGGIVPPGLRSDVEEVVVKPAAAK